MDSSDYFKSAKFDDHEDQQRKKTPDTIDIFESIKINDEFEEEEYRRKTRKRLIIIAISTIILVLILIGSILGTLVPMHTKDSSTKNQINSLKTICNTTLYQDSCYSSIYSLKTTTNSASESPKEIFMLSLQVAFNELVRLKSSIPKRLVSYNRNASSLCEHLIKDAINHVNISISSLQSDDNDMVSDTRTWLSTAITDQETCLIGLTEFDNISLPIHEEINAAMKNATEFTSNSLAIISNMIQCFQIPVHRKLLQEHEKGSSVWVHRRLLEANLRPNLVVSKNGSGDFRTITDAVSAMPKRSKDRFFIYVKEGEYEEKVVIDSDCWNLMIYGDGMNKTIVSYSQNFADGVATYLSGTLIVEGRNFIAKDISIKNKSGPKKFQAVAMRSSSDKSIFHSCSFDGYQDTLYAHTNRQFYLNCQITGTIDFIFGNAAAVFQNCTIRAREPRPGQYNTITAQGKSDPNQNTGIVFQNCLISSLGNFTAKTFLGRPWFNYSTTVVMESQIEGVVDRVGWVSWEPEIEPPSSLFYAEYKNVGVGSDLGNRVKWVGFRPNITEEEAENFSVEKFLEGNQWLKKGIQF
ncbi:hypothetical protein RD792_010919 [Penstemon davidsonii]|uniref:Pectinesterase n=1 Tax=Penstemon davidsonii TaxID=160366 RepID=A0ABR0D350_9LAMI|nr:hypothetical protein RD792_010919 [Penstemon davidsonii]